MREEQLVDLVGDGVVGQRPPQETSEQTDLDRVALLGRPLPSPGSQPSSLLSRASGSTASGAVGTAQLRVGSSHVGAQRQKI